MERIKMVYTFDDDSTEITEERHIEMKQEAAEGLRDYNICELFVDFMRACGFSEENVWKYFRD